MPFGYLIFAVALGISALAGIWLLIRGLNRRSAVTGLVGATLLVTAVAAALVNFFAERGRELNPTIRSASELVGVWTGTHLALELQGRGAYICRGTGCKDFTPSGSWARRGHFELELSPGNTGDGAGTPPLRLRVIEYRGRLPLTKAFSDYDLWDGANHRGAHSAGTLTAVLPGSKVSLSPDSLPRWHSSSRPRYRERSSFGQQSAPAA